MPAFHLIGDPAPFVSHLAECEPAEAVLCDETESCIPGSSGYMCCECALSMLLNLKLVRATEIQCSHEQNT